MDIYSVSTTIEDISSSLDWVTFEQVLEMDVDDEREFSSGIVSGQLKDLERSLEKMKIAM